MEDITEHPEEEKPSALAVPASNNSPSPDVPIGPKASMLEDFEMTTKLLNKRMAIARLYQRLGDDIARKRAKIGLHVDAKVKEIDAKLLSPPEDVQVSVLLAQCEELKKKGTSEMDRLQNLHGEVMYDHQKIQQEIGQIMLVRGEIFKNLGVGIIVA